MRIIKGISTAMAIAGLCVGTATSSHASLSIDANRSFDQQTVYNGTWLNATITDTANPGTVTVTFTMAGVPDGYFIDQINLNSLIFDTANPSVTPSVVSMTDGLVFNGLTTGQNFSHADGDGYFDLQFMFADSNSDPAARFTANDQIVLSLTASDLTAQSFEQRSYGAGNSPNGLYIAAHLQGIGDISGINSLWITGEPVYTPDVPVVPEPATVMAGALLLLPFGASAVRILRKKS